MSQKTGDVWFKDAILQKTKIASNDIVATGIAMLSDEDVQSLTRSGLLDTVKAAKDVPHSPLRTEEVLGLDDEPLRRVLYLVRRWMRVKINEQTKRKGWIPYFSEQQ